MIIAVLCNLCPPTATYRRTYRNLRLLGTVGAFVESAGTLGQANLFPNNN